MKKILCIALLLLTFVFSLAACGDSTSIEISDDGYWVIDGKKTDVLAKGEKGDIGEQGIQGENGDKGDDGLTPTIEISEDGYWIINGEKTDVKAKGEDGKDATPSDENPQGLDFYLKDDGTYAVEIGKAKYLSKIAIPGAYNGKAVTEIPSGAFHGSSLVNIIIPNSVSKISEMAFSGCENFKNVFYCGSEEEWNQIESGFSFLYTTVYYDCDPKDLSFDTIDGNTAISTIEKALANLKEQSYWCMIVYDYGEITSAGDKNTVSSEFEETIFDIHNNQSPLQNILLAFKDQELELYKIGDETVFALKNYSDDIINLSVSTENGLFKSFVMIGHGVNGRILLYYEPVDIPTDSPVPEVPVPDEPVDISGFTSLSDFNYSNAVLAAQTGTFHLEALWSQIEGVTVKEYPDFDLLLVALNAGAIDGYITEEPTAFSLIAHNDDLGYVDLKNNTTGFTVSDADTGIAVAFKTGSSYVATVNEILARISPETRSALMQQAVRLSENPDTASNETPILVSSNTTTANGTLKIAMECAYYPFNWTQATNVNGAVKIQGSDVYANGYDVQVAKYIAAELGMALEIYAVEWDSLIPGLQAGVYDGIIAGMSPTAERKEEVDFTDCYYNANLVIIYKKS